MTRKKYYDALNLANNGDYSKILLLVLQALERSLDIYLGSLNNTYDNYRPISNIVEEERLPYGQEYVSLLARKGKIDAFKEGQNWLTTKEAVLDYIEKRERKKKIKLIFIIRARFFPRFFWKLNDYLILICFSLKILFSAIAKT